MQLMCPPAVLVDLPVPVEPARRPAVELVHEAPPKKKHAIREWAWFFCIIFNIHFLYKTIYAHIHSNEIKINLQ